MSDISLFVMSKKYSFLVAGIATLLFLTGCGKEAPSPEPKPTPTPNPSLPNLPPVPEKAIMEVETQDNVMVYTPPKGEEEQYIVSYEGNTLLVRVPQPRGLRSGTQFSYGRKEDGVFKSSTPKKHDIICIEANKKIPNGLIAEIENIDSYGAGDVQRLTLKATTINQVAKNINYDNSINLVDLIVGGQGNKVGIDFSNLLVSEDEASGKKNAKGTPPFKASLALANGKLALKLNADPLFALKDKPQSPKTDLSFALTLNPNIRLRIKKRDKADLPDLFEVSAEGAIDVDIDARLQAELSKKYAGKRVRLASIKVPPIPLGSPAFNLVMYLTVDLEFSMEGKVDAKLKVFQYHNPYKYAIGYDVNHPGRWYAGGDDRLNSKADWFKDWAINANLNLGVAIQSGITCTINGWEGLSTSLGTGIQSDTHVSVKSDQAETGFKLKTTVQPYLFAGIVFQPGIVEWLEYSKERKYQLTQPKTLFDGEIKAQGWDIKIEPKEAWEVKATSVILGAKFSRNLQSPIEVLEYGVCLAEHNQPKIGDRKLKYEGAQSTLDYTVKATGLSPATEYFYRGYVMYKKGSETLVAYSSVRSFTTEEDSNVLPEGVIIENGILQVWPNTSIPESGHVTIPKEVTQIDLRAFFKCSRLKSVTLPSKLKSIGVSAFEDCTQLQTIQIPNSVTQIGDAAFQGCINLKTVDLPNNLRVIGQSTFRGCQALKAIQTKNAHKIAHSAFAQCIRLEKVEFTSALQTIEYGAFQDCRSLTQVTLPHSVTLVYDGAFERCLKLKEIRLSESMTWMAPGVFKDCRSLTQITLPAKIDYVYNDVFLGCTALKTITSKALYAPAVKEKGYDGYKLQYDGKLIVPVGSKDSYEKSIGWGHCSPIVEED